jgi:hypothetical protein
LKEFIEYDGSFIEEFQSVRKSILSVLFSGYFVGFQRTAEWIVLGVRQIDLALKSVIEKIKNRDFLNLPADSSIWAVLFVMVLANSRDRLCTATISLLATE